MKKITAIVLLTVLSIVFMFPSVYADDTTSRRPHIPVMREQNNVMTDEQKVRITATASTNISIDYVMSDDFFIDSKIFNVSVGISDIKDCRTKLKLSVTDECGAVIAAQQDVYYEDYSSCLNYVMQVSGAIDDSSVYKFKFEYSGNYNLQYDSDFCILPISTVSVKSIKLVDVPSNTLKLEFANVLPNQQYTLFCRFDEDDSMQSYDVTIGQDNSATVEFGGTYSINNTLYVCDYGATSSLDCYQEVYLFKFDNLPYADQLNATEGVYTDNIYEHNSSYDIWFQLYNKAYAAIPYTKEDLDKVSVYLYDVTTGRIVTNGMNDLTFDSGLIEGYVTPCENLLETHQYVMVFNDDSSTRIVDDFVVTSKKIIEFGSIYTINNKYAATLPSGETGFYAYFTSYNIDDPENIEYEIFDDNGTKVDVAINKVSPYKIKFTADKPFETGDYTIKATYNDIVTIGGFKVVEKSEKRIRQVVYDTVIYNGKTYILAGFNSNDYNPSKLTYKVVKPDGTVYNAKFQRLLTGDNYDKMFVLTVDEELNNIYSSNNVFLKMYDGNKYLTPQYRNNTKIYYTNEVEQPFIYEYFDINDNGITIFYEGFSSAPTIEITTYDEATGKNVTITPKSATKTSAKFNAADFKAITTYHYIGSNYDTKLLYVDVNGDFSTTLYAYVDQGLFNSKPIDTFSFQNVYSKGYYAAVNLPYQTYDYYKIASTPKALADASYNEIEPGIFTKLSQTDEPQYLYAMFKTADGKESEIMKTLITVDAVKPTLEVTSDIPESFVVDRRNCVEFDITVNASEDGEFHYYLYNKFGERINAFITNSLTTGENTINMYINIDEDAKNIEKIGVYMTDRAGNKSDEHIFDFEIVDNYINYQTSTTLLRINSETGVIEYADTDGLVINIPSSINGITVTGIGSYAFARNSYINVIIPETVTNIDNLAFWNLSSFNITAKENSPAHMFAKDNNIDFIPLSYVVADTDLSTGNVTVTPVNIASGSTVVVAYYSGNRLVHIGTQQYKSGDLSFNYDGTADSVKILAVDDLTKFNPLCEMLEN